MLEILNKHKTPKSVADTATYIGRGAPFGNPYVIGTHGARDEVIAMYRPYLARKLIHRDPVIENAMRALQPDSKLLCFCAPHHCHGSVVSEYWHELFDSGLSYEAALKAFEKNHAEEIAKAVAVFLDMPLDDLRTDRQKVNTDPEDRRGISKLTYDPLEDGITHINVWSKGRTELGRLASNFAKTPFLHPVYGHFSSVEGFWYWLATGKQFNELRSLSGYESKKAGQLIKKKAEEARAAGDPNAGTWPVVPDFEAQIKKAILCKVEQNDHFRELLKESTLPLAHYYVWGDPDKVAEPGEEPKYKITVPHEFAWTYQYLEALRRWLNGKASKLIIFGTRHIDNDALIEEAYTNGPFEAIEIVSGCARGVDTNGEHLAQKLKLPIMRFPADWDRFKKSAGYIRNVEMGNYGDAGLGIWDGISPGTAHMENILINLGKPCSKLTVAAGQVN